MNQENMGLQAVASPYARSAQRYIDNGLFVIPIAPAEET